MTTRNYILYTVLALALLSLAGCKDDSSDPKVDALNKQLAALQNKGSSWVMGATGSVKKDNFDVSSQFAGFKLTIGNKTYTTQNSLASAWKTSGTWDFQGENPNRVVRDDGTEISVSISNNTLTLTFTVPGSNSNVRSGSIAGTYEFRLVSE